MHDTQQIAYQYHDEKRTLLYSKVRTQPKGFYWQRIENGNPINGIGTCRKVLYRLPQLKFGLDNERTIFLVEGEKDADTLLNQGLIATTAPGSLEWNKEFTQTLKDADVIILYDYDKTGCKRRDLLCKELYGKVKRLRVINLPGLEYSESHGKDVSDWLALGHTKEELLNIVSKTSDYVPPNKLRTVSVDELFSIKLPMREMLLSPFLPSQGLVLLFAKRGVGKTHIALGIAYAVATGGTFLHWHAPIAKKVLYIDGEMPAILMKERLQMIASMTGKMPDAEFLKLITPDLQNQTIPNLSTKKGRMLIEEYIKDADLIVFDNISCLFRSGSENEAESWQEIQEWGLDLRRRGKSILFVHHAGKNGNQRGTSKKEDTLDSVIVLKHPDDYQPEDGARFEIHFDKARHFSGGDARSFQAQLIEESGCWHWELSEGPKEKQIAQIAEMKNNGLTIKQIIEETQLTKSQIETLTKKAKHKGLLH